MKAKFINEIKRNDQTSGLESIGIGTVSVFEPLLAIMKSLVGQKFSIYYGDTGEPASEVTYTFAIQENDEFCELYTDSEDDMQDEVWLKYHKLERMVSYKEGIDRKDGNKGIIIFNNAPKFFSIFKDEDTIYKIFKEDIEEYLRSCGFRIYDY